MIEFLFLLAYFVIGFTVISLFTKYASKRSINADEFIIGIIIWPIVTFFVFFDFLGRMLDILISKKIDEYIDWIQKDKK
jgi:hypothetical protein